MLIFCKQNRPDALSLLYGGNLNIPAFLLACLLEKVGLELIYKVRIKFQAKFSLVILDLYDHVTQ